MVEKLNIGYDVKNTFSTLDKLNTNIENIIENYDYKKTQSSSSK